MSEYSRWVEERGTISIVSLRALRQASKPVASSRLGGGAFDGSPGDGLNDDCWLAQYGWTLKPYSDWIPSAGIFGLNGGRLAMPGDPWLESLSSATTVSTRLSTAWTFDTAKAPSECPTIATRVRRPRVTDRLSRLRLKSRQSGLKRFTGVSALRLRYGLRGGEGEKLGAARGPQGRF